MDQSAGVTSGHLELYAVVHPEFDWVSGHIQPLHFTALQLEIAIDHPVREYATGE